MSNTEIYPAPEIQHHTSASVAKLDNEKRAFQRLLPALLSTHRGLYVAIHGEEVVGSGSDKIAVALDAYRKVGYVQIYVGHVTVQPPAPIRVPTYHILRPESAQGNA